MGKLDETRNFLELFCYAAGDNEVPEEFIFWAGMSLLAASVADRVVLEPDRGRRIVPNLYVFLLGPSGTGKEYAIHQAAKYAIDQPIINLYGGQATSQYLLRHLARRVKGDGNIWKFVNTKLYFMTEELGMCTRPGEQAHDLVTTMTGLYKGAPYPFRKGTITGDDLTIPSPCLNWFAGSTDDWLVKTVGRDAVMGGFTVRLVTVRAKRDYTKRRPQMIFPDDLEEVRAHLRERVKAYTEIEGALSVGPEAQEIHDKWYCERPAPEDEEQEPSFNKADEMVLRFATLLALADWDAIVYKKEESLNGDGESHAVIDEERTQEGPEVIQAHHMQQAIDMWEGISQVWMPEVVKLASSTYETSAIDVVRSIIRRMGQIDRSTLIRRVNPRGLDADKLDRALRTLIGEEAVEVGRVASKSGPAKTLYTWKEASIT